MDTSQKAENSSHHVELKDEVASYSERLGRVTSTANAHLSEAGVKEEDEVVTIESSDEEADVPGPSGMRNWKTVRH